MNGAARTDQETRLRGLVTVAEHGDTNGMGRPAFILWAIPHRFM